VPVCPSSKTTRVDATLRPRRNNVAMRRTDGNEDNSSAERVLRVIITINKPNIMLNVNRMSKKIVGSGTMSSASISRTSVGPPTLEMSMDLTWSEIRRKFDVIAFKTSLEFQ
jgi:hypothetical protein